MKAVAVLSSIVAFIAGGYLLSTQAVADNSFLEVIAHGMGIYFLAKGLWLGPSLWTQHESRRHLEQLARGAGVLESKEQQRERERRAALDLARPRNET